MSNSMAKYIEAEKLKDDGKLEEAVAKLEEVIAEDESFALAHSALAVLYGKSDQHELAISMFRRAVEIRREKLAPDHYLTASLLSDFGRCLTDVGNHAEAEAILLEALAILDTQRDAQRSRWDTVNERLATLYDAMDRPEDAARYRDAAEAADGP